MSPSVQSRIFAVVTPITLLVVPSGDLYKFQLEYLLQVLHPQAFSLGISPEVLPKILPKAPPGIQEFHMTIFQAFHSWMSPGVPPTIPPRSSGIHPILSRGIAL